MRGDSGFLKKLLGVCMPTHDRVLGSIGDVDVHTPLQKAFATGMGGEGMGVEVRGSEGMGGEGMGGEGMKGCGGKS